MHTGASNIQRLSDFLPFEVFAKTSKNKLFIRSLWRCKFPNISSQELFCKQLIRLIELGLIPIEHLPVYQLSLWHKKHLEKHNMSFPIEDLQKVNLAFSYIEKNASFWKTLLKLLRQFPTNELIFIIGKTHTIVKLSDLYKSNIDQIKSLQEVLKKNIHKSNDIQLKLCFQMIQWVKQPHQLILLLEQFTSNAIYLLLKKTGISEIPQEELLWSWMKLYVSHQNPQLLMHPELELGTPLSNMPFEEVLRNSPTLFLKCFHFLSDQDKKVFVHLAQGKNIRTLQPFQHMTRAMAHEFVNLSIESFDVFNIFGKFNSDIFKLKYPLACFSTTTVPIPFIHLICNYFIIPSGDFSEKMMKELLWYKAILSKLIDWFEPPALNRPIEPRDVMSYVEHCYNEKITFDISKKTLNSMTNTIRSWRKEQLLAAEKFRSWKGPDLKPWKQKTNEEIYEIIQLTDSNQLVEESIEMHHCVSTYAKSCKKGKCSIWSLRKSNEEGVISLVTIELNKKNKIVQTKAKYNTRPSISDFSIIKKWAKREGIKIKKYVLEGIELSSEVPVPQQ